MSKIKKKRVGFVLDMTPLVDITFLLLTFFMFTAKFKSQEEGQERFVIKRPVTVSDTAKVPEKDLVTIKIAVDTVSKDTAWYYSMLNEQDRIRLANQMVELKYPGATPLTTQFKVTDTTWLQTFVKESRVVNTQAIFAIDSDRNIRYKWVEQVMTALRRYNATSFNFVTDKKQ